MKVEVDKTYKVKPDSLYKCSSFSIFKGNGVDEVTITDITNSGNISYRFVGFDGRPKNCSTCLKKEDLMEVKKELKDIEQGDIIVHKEGAKEEIIGRCGGAIFSTGNGFGVYSWTIKELERQGYSVYQEPEEMTLAEVCKELGREIKIKK